MSDTTERAADAIARLAAATEKLNELAAELAALRKTGEKQK